MSFRRINDTERFPLNDTLGMIIIDVPLIETWKAMEALVKKGKLKTIGVSNLSIAKIEEIWDDAEIKPAVNQVELHPYFAQPDLVKWCQNKVRAGLDHREVVTEVDNFTGDRCSSLQPAWKQYLRRANVSAKYPGQCTNHWLIMTQGHRRPGCD